MGRREENKRAKRARLEAAAMQLFLREGYDRTSIEQIVSDAEVARGTFYLYFPDKLTLFEALVDRWYLPSISLLEEVETQLNTATHRDHSLGIYAQMALGLARLGQTCRDEFLIAFAEARRPGEVGDRLRARELRLHDIAIRFTERARDRGLITAADPQLIGLVIFGATERLVYETLIGRVTTDANTLATEVLNLFGRVLELPVPSIP